MCPFAAADCSLSDEDVSENVSEFVFTRSAPRFFGREQARLHVMAVGQVVHSFRPRSELEIRKGREHVQQVKNNSTCRVCAKATGAGMKTDMGHEAPVALATSDRAVRIVSRDRRPCTWCDKRHGARDDPSPGRRTAYHEHVPVPQPDASVTTSDRLRKITNEKIILRPQPSKFRKCFFFQKIFGESR